MLRLIKVKIIVINDLYGLILQCVHLQDHVLLPCDNPVWFHVEWVKFLEYTAKLTGRSTGTTFHIIIFPLNFLADQLGWIELIGLHSTKDCSQWQRLDSGLQPKNEIKYTSRRANSHKKLELQKSISSLSKSPSKPAHSEISFVFLFCSAQFFRNWNYSPSYFPVQLYYFISLFWTK